MVRIELGENNLTICGSIEEISYTSTINGEGKISNRTYIKLNDLMMENPEDSSVLNILPKEFSKKLFIDKLSENKENAAVELTELD
jgi:hypothetical protein